MPILLLLGFVCALGLSIIQKTKSKVSMTRKCHNNSQRTNGIANMTEKTHFCVNLIVGIVFYKFTAIYHMTSRPGVK